MQPSMMTASAMPAWAAMRAAEPHQKCGEPGHRLMAGIVGTKADDIPSSLRRYLEQKTNKAKTDRPEWAHKNRQSADHAAAVWRESHSRPCDRPRSRQYNERRSGRAPERRTASYGSRRRPYCRPATAGEDTLRRQNALCRFFFEKSCKRAEKPLDIREKKAIIMFECCGIV